MKIAFLDFSGVANAIHKHRYDLIILLLLMVQATAIAFMGAHWVNPVVIDNQAKDVWFGADLPRVFHHMATRPASHNRLNVHPLFSLVTYPFVYAVMAVHVPKEEAVKVVIAAAAGLWVGLFFVILRGLGCRRLDATLFSVLALTSSGFIFWTVVPESYLFGSLTMVGALGFVVWTQFKPRSHWWYVVVSAATLTITTTNWMAGIFATFVNLVNWEQSTWQKSSWTTVSGFLKSLRITVQALLPSLWITVQAFLLVVLLWPIQKFLFRSAEFFVGGTKETRFMFLPSAGGPLHVFCGFVYHSLIMPAIYILPSNPRRPNWPLMSVQFAWPGSGSFWGMAAAGLWTVFLGLGLWACWRSEQHRKPRMVLALILLGQLALFLVYGDETFLYAMQIMPFLILVCAFLTLTRWRGVALTLSVLLIITAGINNAEQFRNATDFLNRQGPLQQVVPAEPWIKTSAASIPTLASL